jgi:hypothetical protein
MTSGTAPAAAVRQHPHDDINQARIVPFAAEFTPDGRIREVVARKAGESCIPARRQRRGMPLHALPLGGPRHDPPLAELPQPPVERGDRRYCP